MSFSAHLRTYSKVGKRWRLHSPQQLRMLTPDSLLAQKILPTSSKPINDILLRGKSTSASDKTYTHAQDIGYKTLVEMQRTVADIFSDRHLFGTRNEASKSKPWEWMTYAEFQEKVDSCMAGLAGVGVEPGDKVACISNNRWEWAVAAYATYNLGASFVPMYEAQKPKEWSYIINDSDAKVLLTSKKEIYRQTYHFAGVIGSLKEVVCFESAMEKEHSFQRLLENGAAKNFSDFRQNPSVDDIATVIYSSGTTGNPKGVELAHRSLVHNIRGMWPISPPGGNITLNDTSLSFLPWAHCYGQTCELHTMMAHGGRIALAGGIDTLLRDLGEIKPSLLFSVPTLFKKVYDGVQAKFAEEKGVKKVLIDKAMEVANTRREMISAQQTPGPWLDLQHKVLDKVVLSKIRDRMGGNIRIAWVGGAATGMDVLKFFDNIGIPICEGYGLTETSPLIAVNSPDPKLRRLGTVGMPLDGVEVKIMLGGKEMPAGTEGEICVSGDNVMIGYRNNKEATDEVITFVDGKRFFRTGDLGALDAENMLRITGRLKEQYKLENGKYVVPGPIEAALQGSRYITQAVLYGDNRQYNVALVVPDWQLVADWAVDNTELGPDADLAALSQNKMVQHLIEGEIQNSCNEAGVKKYEIPKRWLMLEEGFTAERGMLTPKMSIKRHVVFKTYMNNIELLYEAEKDEDEPATIAA
mmetsp:Transcript_11136/g.14550  ORF Transcript_11136/g.14550 Transcript_11136/m.14550 type:complete len:695 (-) Transcript_11136:339-2423(-)